MTIKKTKPGSAKQGVKKPVLVKNESVAAVPVQKKVAATRGKKAAPKKKIFGLTLQDIFSIPTAELFNADQFETVTSVSIDSRSVVPGSLFIAIKGDRYDGHAFVLDAVQKGASAVLILKMRLKKFQDLPIPIITVDDTTKALGHAAALFRNKFKFPVIGITGSNGKTSTKDFLAALLAKKYETVKTAANNNNHIGVPITLFSAAEKTQAVVLEIGTNHFGEIAYTANISAPDYAIITLIGNSHLEFFKNRRGVLKEKSDLLKVTAKKGGTVFINIDDPLLVPLAAKYPKVVTFGFSEGADIRGAILNRHNDGTTTLLVQSKKEKITVDIPLLGEENAKNLLCAISVALTLGIKKNSIIEAVHELEAPKGRLCVTKYDYFTLIDDTYNANPDSMVSAAKTLSLISERKYKIMVLGDMLELGKASQQLHSSLAKEIKQFPIDAIYFIGKNMRYCYEHLLSSNIDTYYALTRLQMKKMVHMLDLFDSAILVKGSRGMKMEEFVSGFLERGSGLAEAAKTLKDQMNVFVKNLCEDGGEG